MDNYDQELEIPVSFGKKVSFELWPKTNEVSLYVVPKTSMVMAQDLEYSIFNILSPETGA